MPAEYGSRLAGPDTKFLQGDKQSPAIVPAPGCHYHCCYWVSFNLSLLHIRYRNPSILFCHCNLLLINRYLYGPTVYGCNLVTNEIMQLYDHGNDDDYDGEPVFTSSTHDRRWYAGCGHGSDQELVGAFLRYGEPAATLYLRKKWAQGAVNHERYWCTYLRDENFLKKYVL